MSVTYTLNGTQYTTSGTSSNPQGALPAGATLVSNNAVATPIQAADIGTQPVKLPGQPNGSNQNTTLAGASASNANPATGLTSDANGIFTNTPQTNNTADNQTQIDQNYINNLLNIKPPSATDTYNSLPEKAQFEQAQRDVQNYTGQINAIVSKSQADQLAAIGQGRGIPEAIIGGQQAQISREAAIKALPLQALLANAQGNLELAQSHLDTVFKLKMEDATNNYKYKKDLIDAVYDIGTKSEQRKLDALSNTAKQNFSLLQDTINFTQSLSADATKNGDVATAAKLAQLAQPDQNSPTFRDDLAKYNAQVSAIQATMKPDALRQAQINNINSEINARNNPTNPDNILSVADATTLGLPYGTTKQAAANLGITPKKPATAQQQLVINNAQSGLGAIQTIEAKVFPNGVFDKSQLQLAAIPLSLGARDTATALKEAADVITRLRTGAALNESEQKFYSGQLPSYLDSEKTVKYKLDLLKSLYAGAAGSSVTISNGTDTYTFDNIMTPEARKNLRDALQSDYTITSY